jgi:hypothetical protein
MGSTRALFASIGVSVSLVAAAALSLFTVSVVIAFGGWSAGLGEPQPVTTLVLGSTEPTHAKAVGNATRAGREPVVMRAPAAPRPRRATKPPARAAASAGIQNATGVISRPVVSSRPPVVAQPTAGTSVPVVAPKPKTVDGVRRAGEDLSSVLHKTGKALTDLTAPLGPPVASAVQKVLDLVAVLLQRTTSSLGGVLDGLTKKHQ